MPPPGERKPAEGSSVRDIFKILTRGTNIKARPFDSKTAASHPSAGSQANPQLFHDEIRGHKRKRPGDDTTGPKKTESDLPEVDFFAPKTEPASEKKHVERKEPSAQEAAPTATAASLLTTEECRQVLKSHRIKVTLMWKYENQSRVKKSKKKKKVEVEVKKEQKKQLSPQPLESFGQLRSIYGIPRRVSDNLFDQGFREPTEVQLGCTPLLLKPEVAVQDEEGLEDGVDFLAVAPTGSGKTISFLIATINSIMRRRSAETIHGNHELEAVIVAPTRELAHQIVNEGNKLAQGTGMKIIGMKRGMQVSDKQAEPDEKEVESEQDEPESESDDEKAKSKSKPSSAVKADILVTTPMLLLKYLKSGSGNKVLPTVRELVLDEADVLLDPLFREQSFGIWNACTNPDLRLSCWSATMGSNIETLVTEKLQARAAALDIIPKPLVRLVVGLKDTAVPNVSHKLLFSGSEHGKILGMRQLIRPTSSEELRIQMPFLVFTSTIERATALHEELKYEIPISAGGPSRIAALHGGLTDSARSTIVRKFRAGEIWLLITTDLMARGLDFRGVNGVVNYDVPTSSASYVHRAGRTGRAGRQGGIAVTMWTEEDIAILRTVANVIIASEKQAGKPEAESAVPKFLLDRLPNVSKADKKSLKTGKGIPAAEKKSKITSTSGFDRQKEHNKRGAIEANKRRKVGAHDDRGGGDEEWSGFAD